MVVVLTVINNLLIIIITYHFSLVTRVHFGTPIPTSQAHGSGSSDPGTSCKAVWPSIGYTASPDAQRSWWAPSLDPPQSPRWRDSAACCLGHMGDSVGLGNDKSEKHVDFSEFLGNHGCHSLRMFTGHLDGCVMETSMVPSPSAFRFGTRVKGLISSKLGNY